MSSNKGARKELEKIYGKKDMFEKARIAERIEARGGIRTYKEYKNHVKFKRSRKKQMEKTMNYHHLMHKKDGGKATVENGAIVNSLAHQYMHSLPRDQEEIINNMLRDYKKGLIIDTAIVTTKEIKPMIQITFDDLFKRQEYIEIEVEPMTPEELEKYEAYKRARNERVKEKFKGEKEI